MHSCMWQAQEQKYVVKIFIKGHLYIYWFPLKLKCEIVIVQLSIMEYLTIHNLVLLFRTHYRCANDWLML